MLILVLVQLPEGKVDGDSFIFSLGEISWDTLIHF